MNNRWNMEQMVRHADTDETQNIEEFTQGPFFLEAILINSYRKEIG